MLEVNSPNFCPMLVDWWVLFLLHIHSVLLKLFCKSDSTDLCAFFCTASRLCYWQVVQKVGALNWRPSFWPCFSPEKSVRYQYYVVSCVSTFHWPPLFLLIGRSHLILRSFSVGLMSHVQISKQQFLLTFFTYSALSFGITAHSWGNVVEVKIKTPLTIATAVLLPH